MHIKVKVFPGSKENRVDEVSPERLKCYIKEKPQNNLANKKLISLLADHFSVPENSIRIVKGHKTPNKIVFIEK